MRRLGINRVLIKKKKINNKNKLRKTYCMFFCRFGRCHNSECRYVHDPEKVAVCTRFLRGTCRFTDCPFSHKVIPEKMPVCSFFLQGRCKNDNCPYIHVNVNPEARICDNFAKGFCAEGEKCKYRHVFVRKKGSNSGEADKSVNAECATQTKNKWKKLIYRKRETSKPKLDTNNSVTSDDSLGFIPLIKGLKNSSNDDVDEEKHCEMTPNKLWSTFDYDSDDTWNNDEEVNDSQVKKPLIRILPRFLTES